MNNTTKNTDKYLDAFNGLFDTYSKWERTRWHGNLTDDFGDSIPMGETYFLKKSAVTLRLSSRSMEKLLSVLFPYNKRLLDIANKMNEIDIKIKEQNKLDALQKLEKHFPSS